MARGICNVETSQVLRQKKEKKKKKEAETLTSWVFIACDGCVVSQVPFRVTI